MIEMLSLVRQINVIALDLILLLDVFLSTEASFPESEKRIPEYQNVQNMSRRPNLKVQ